MRKLLMAIVLSLLLIGCSGKEEVTIQETTTQEETVTGAVTEVPTETGTEEAEAPTEEEADSNSLEDLDEETKGEHVLSILERGFEGSANVYQSDDYKEHLIELKDDLSLEVLTAIVSTDDEEEMAKWDSFVDVVVKTSETITGMYGEGYKISVLMPASKEALALSVLDGEVIYDVLADK